jgi:hypothetical protein
MCLSQTTLVGSRHNERDDCDYRWDDERRAAQVADWHPPNSRHYQPEREQAIHQNGYGPHITAPRLHRLFAAFRFVRFRAFGRSARLPDRSDGGGAYSRTLAPHPCFALLCEAKTLASLNHPHHDHPWLREGAGTYALVMEFVDGSSRELANCAVARKLPE